MEHRGDGREHRKGKHFQGEQHHEFARIVVRQATETTDHGTKPKAEGLRLTRLELTQLELSRLELTRLLWGEDHAALDAMR